MTQALFNLYTSILFPSSILCIQWILVFFLLLLVGKYSVMVSLQQPSNTVDFLISGPLSREENCAKYWGRDCCCSHKLAQLWNCNQLIKGRLSLLSKADWIQSRSNYKILLLITVGSPCLVMHLTNVFVCLTRVSLCDHLQTHQHGSRLLSQHCLWMSGSVTLGDTGLQLLTEKDH